tara:strand:- start:945 stop:1499 length:555 start_codon:yes stop_codon:yes gene_type:complete
MSSNTLEIIQGLAQAAANGWDGNHDERYALSDKPVKTGLKREEGCPIMDKRVLDGFGVKFYGNSICITYQGECSLEEAKDPKFESDVEKQLNDIKKFLQKEYKAITGKGITLSKNGEVKMIVQTTSRLWTWVQAYQHYKIGGIDSDPILEPSRDTENDVMRKFLEQSSNKKPQNYKVKKGANDK